MARASAKRGGRPRPDARQGGQKQDPVAGTEAKPKQATRPKKQASYEDQLFFTRLRRKTKWVFALLAAAFAIGFVVFGVGTGVSGANLGDFFRDIFGGDGSGEAPAVADALEEVEDNPGDPEALLELATAYRAAGQNADAAETLERYVELQPSDGAAIRQLTAVYLALAREADQRAAALASRRSVGQSLSSQAWAFPDTSGFLGALGENPVEQAVDLGYSRAAREVGAEATRFAVKRAAAFEKLALAEPDDPTVLFQLGQAAIDALQNEKAIDAFERYLAAAPDGEYAESAQQALDQLTGNVDVVEG
jgi:tetratricopeptide (TPR) repeat protein